MTYMPHATAHQRTGRLGAPARLFGAGLALAIAGVWIALTALTGKTYHLAPIFAAAAPGMTDYILCQRQADRNGRMAAVIATLLGLAVVALAWGIISALGNEPTATVVSNQPGGVQGEVLVGAIVGAALGSMFVLRRRPARTS